MESNRQLELAWEVVENTGASLYLTGKAGTGKTTFLRRLKEKSKKRMVVLAPTGIAAINAGGVTIHSFFQLPFSPYIPGTEIASDNKFVKLNKTKRNIIRALDLLVIDEISMVRADLLDAVDMQLRRVRGNELPFGGVQLLLIGDLQQLPPVLRDAEAHLLSQYYPTSYFFESKALQQLDYRMIELTKVYRQTNEEFVRLLNDIRSGHPSAETLMRLNERCRPGLLDSDEKGFVRLTTHNDQAAVVNERQLSLLAGEPHTFAAQVQGIFPESSYPAEDMLVLKEGAQVMFVKNDPSPEKQYYNGMIGEVLSIVGNEIYVEVPERIEPIKVTAETWENVRYLLDETSGEIREVLDGSFIQIPLKLAWAITIHKSQGLTFPKAVIDASRSFAHGQTYVALSRCQSLEGLVLERPLSMSSIICDQRVNHFMAQAVERGIDASVLEILRGYYRLRCLDEIFDTRGLFWAAGSYCNVVSEGFLRLFPMLVSRFGEYMSATRPKMEGLYPKFASQYRRILSVPEPDLKLLDERLKAAARYYLDELEGMRNILGNIPTEHDNKSVKKRLGTARQSVSEALKVKLGLLRMIVDRGFSVEEFLDVKARMIATPEREVTVTVKKSTNRQSATAATAKFAPAATSATASAPVLAPEDLGRQTTLLYERLRSWRLDRANGMGKPAFAVMSNKTMLAIAQAAPRNADELEGVKGVGPHIMANYADEILGIVSGS